MKTFLEDLGRKIGETAEIVTNKAGEAVEIQKLRTQIRSLERACERDYMELGRTVYEHYKDGEVVDAEAIGICEAIQNREENIGKYEQQVSELKGDAKCDGCGKTVAKEMAYCPYCGTKVPEEVKEESADATQTAGEAAPEETVSEQEISQVEEQIEESIGTMKEKVVDMAGKAKEKTEDAADIVRDKTVTAADIVRDKTVTAADVVKEKAADVAEVIKEKAREAEEKIKSMTEE